MLSLRRPIAPRFFLTQVRGRRLASPAERRRKHVTLDAPVSVNSEESPVLRWLMTDGRRITDPKSFLENFAMCLTEAGVDVSRVTTGVPVLHPQLYSYSGLWERGKGVTERLYRADASQDAILTNSPIKSAYEGSPFRSRLTAPAVEGEFPILTELRRTGMTDYVVLPVPFSDGTNKALSLATAQDGGFPDGELTLFTAMTPAVASILEIQALRRMARTLLDTYVGRQSGGRVLAGQIRRGMGETIRAAIWLSDLRGFTSLSESPPRDELIELLNQYFGPMCDAVEANGGEVLKLIGDAMLAIFPVEDDAVAAGRKALGAVRVAEGAVNKGNERRASDGKPRIHYGLALALKLELP
jgi:adenylate cyclase